MAKGTVKFFNETKGFGFITEEGAEKDFVHLRDLLIESKTVTLSSLSWQKIQKECEQLKQN